MHQVGILGRGTARDERILGPSSRERIVRVFSRQRGIARRSDFSVPIEDLRPEPKGTEAILPIKDDLNGRIEGFGSRFWNHVLDRCGPLREDLEQKGPLKGVLYSDRYIADTLGLGATAGTHA